MFERKAYAIHLNSGVQGTMNAIPRNNEAYSDTTVQIVVNADEDYAVESLTVKNDTTNGTIGTTLKSQDGQTSIYEFTMPASTVTVTATYTEARMLAASLYAFHEAEVAYRTAMGMGN